MSTTVKIDEKSLQPKVEVKIDEKSLLSPPPVEVKIDEKSSLSPSPRPKVEVEVKIDEKSSLSPPPRPKVGVVNEKTPLLPSSRTMASALAPRPNCGFWCIVCCIVVPSAILYALAGAMSPQGFDWPSVKVDSLYVENFNVSAPDSRIFANWNVSFMFTNPYSSARLNYHELSAAISYKSEFLGGTFINPFLQQPAEEKKLVPVAVTASPILVSNHITKAIDTERRGTGALNFNVKMHAYVRLEGKGLFWLLGRSGEYEMLVNCKKLTVQLSSSTSGKSMARECDLFWSPRFR